MELHYLSGNTRMSLIFARLALRDKMTSERMYVISIGYYCCRLRLWKGTWYRKIKTLSLSAKLEKSIHFLSWAREKMINLFRGWDIKICNYSNVWLPFCLLHLIPWEYRKWIRSITSVSVSVKIIIFFQLKLSINVLRPVDDFCFACLSMKILSQIIANIIFNLKCPFHIFVLPSLWTF